MRLHNGGEHGSGHFHLDAGALFAALSDPSPDPPQALLSGLFDSRDVAKSGGGNETASLGHGADRDFGRAGDDILFGHGGHDLLLGGDGADDLHGRDGELYGGDGEDKLKRHGDDLPEGGAGNDHIKGMQRAEDILYVRESTGAGMVHGFVSGKDFATMQRAAATDVANLTFTETDAGVEACRGDATAILNGVTQSDLHETDFVCA